MNIPEPMCKCYTPPLHYSDFITSDFGVDETNSRYADVTVHVCIHCGTKWIKYLVEFEAFSESGRWYRGIISDDVLKSMTPEKVIGYLESLDWYIYGGSYFYSTGMYGCGKARVDFLS